jgi:hypothetical protein
MKKILHITALLAVLALSVPVALESFGHSPAYAFNAEAMLAVFAVSFVALFSLHDYGRASRRFRLAPKYLSAAAIVRHPMKRSRIDARATSSRVPHVLS